MILKKISPLIYKLQVDDGKFVIVHVNRLKRAHEKSNASKDALKTRESKRDRVKELSKQNTPRRCREAESPLDERIDTPPTRIDEIEGSGVIDTDEESVDASPTRVNREHPEWTPETRYLRRKISKEVEKSEEGPRAVPYALRSRKTRTQSQGEVHEVDQSTLGEIEQSSSNTGEIDMQSNTPHTHSYNLRNRARTQTS
jgi:hypothetical protein